MAALARADVAVAVAIHSTLADVAGKFVSMEESTSVVTMTNPAIQGVSAAFTVGSAVREVTGSAVNQFDHHAWRLGGRHRGWS